MSRVGRKSIVLPEKIQVEKIGRKIIVKKDGQEIILELLPGLSVELEDQLIKVNRKDDDRRTRSFHGLMRSLLQNAVSGLDSGFERQLEIVGVGMRAELKKGESENDGLSLRLGFSHPVEFRAPAGVGLSVEQNQIRVFGADKSLVHQTAASIRAIKPPDAYKGKGIRYRGEKIQLKPGKAASTGEK